MIKKFLLPALALSILLTSCGDKSSANRSSGVDFIEATIDGKAYKEEFVAGTFGFMNQKGCESLSKPHYLQNVGQIYVAAYSFDLYLRFFQNDVDFKNSAPKSAPIYQESIMNSTSPGCNLDFEADLDDESFSTNSDKNTTLILQESSGKTTSITKLKESSTSVTYRVNGEFSCKFKNKNNKIIPVVGKFQTTYEANK